MAINPIHLANFSELSDLPNLISEIQQTNRLIDTSPYNPRTIPTIERYVVTGKPDAISSITPYQPVSHVKISTTEDVSNYIHNISDALDSFIRPVANKYGNRSYDLQLSRIYDDLESTISQFKDVTKDTTENLVSELSNYYFPRITQLLESVIGNARSKFDRSALMEIESEIRNFYQFIGGNVLYGFNVEEQDVGQYPGAFEIFVDRDRDPSKNSIIREVLAPACYLRVEDGTGRLYQQIIKGSVYLYDLS